MEYEITGLALGDPNSFRVSAVTDHGRNATGNIINATAFSDFEIGELEIDTDDNPVVVDVRFSRVDTGNNATVSVIYPNTVVDFRCDISLQHAGTNQTYTGLTAVTYDTDYDYSDFTFNDVGNESILMYCWEAPTPTIEGEYLLGMDSFPFVDQINEFRAGTFGTSSEIGGLDLVTLIVIIISMVAFNRTNVAAGILVSVMIIGTTSYFGIIQIPTIIMGALVLIVMLAIVVTRKY